MKKTKQGNPLQDEPRRTHDYKLGDKFMFVELPMMNKDLVWGELKPVCITDIRGDFIRVSALDGSPVATVKYGGYGKWPARFVWVNPHHIMPLEDIPLDLAPPS